MNTTAEIYLWGKRIGIIHQDLNKSYASFEYDEEFLRSNIEIFPLLMPLSNKVYEFPLLAGEPFYGLPGLVSDSLPDSFGNKLIENWLAKEGKSINDFTAIDRLCYIGKRGMGALEYKPIISDIGNIDEIINVNKMVEFASDILSSRKNKVFNTNDNLTYSQLIQVGTSAGGARAKALIAWNQKTNEIRSGQIELDNDFDYWLMKFDNITNNGDYGLKDSPQYTLIEYAYYKMALDAGINMSECRLYKSGNANHFLTKRFDRVNGKKIHMLSLGALAHINYKQPGICSYELASQYMRNIGLTAKEIEELYRRMVFNYFAVNQDDHVKNISFLMDKQGKWSLSPAYDVTFAYNLDNIWLKSHQMSINGKVDSLMLVDLIESGINMGLKKIKCYQIINKVKLVVSNFDKYAKEVNIKESIINKIKNVIDNTINSCK